MALGTDSRAAVVARWLGFAALALGVGCGGGGDPGGDAGRDASADVARGDGAAYDGGGVPDAGPVPDGGDTCEPEGHFGVPTNTFMLPAQGTGDNQVINYPDIQQSFPNVHWDTLERLYLPAGHYKSLLIANLPLRDPAHPLVITNHGGQVFIGNNPTGNYIWSITGGSGWVLTGRYDAMSQTGDPGFPGHRCGHYANSADTYGIVSDDGFAFSAPYLHMGIAVQSATKFEIEYVEVRRSGFAGIRLINGRMASDPAMPMEDVHVHDVYVHDTGGEGFYFGWTGTPPSNAFPGLEIYNTRILRTGNEALQIQDLADGAHVHHNVFAAGGLHWLDNGLGRYQDNGAQITTRQGAIELDHNLFMDGAGSIVSFWSQPETGDGERQVHFHDNVFADTLSEGVYFGGTSGTGSSFEWRDNFFRGLVYGYQLITPTDMTGSTNVIDFDSRITAPISLVNNHWEGSRTIAGGITGGSGMHGVVTASGNTNGPVAAVSFVNPGWQVDNPGHHLTAWADHVTVVDGNATVTYRPGDVVAYGTGPDFFQCTTMTTAGPPPMHPEAWMPLPRPADDLRVAGDSPYVGIGVH